VTLWLLLTGCGVSMHAWDTDDEGDTDTAAVDDTADDTDDDTAIDTDVGATGVAGLVEFTKLQVACPACFDASSDLIVDAAAAFHAPANGSWIGWMPATGTCIRNPAPVPLASTTLDLGSFTYLQSGSHSVGLSRQAGANGTIYRGQGLDDADYLRNAEFDVSVPDAPGGTLFVDRGVHTTEGFDSIQPQEMLYVEPGAAFAAALMRSGQSFTWTPTGSGDFFVILIDAYDPDTAAYLGSVMCKGPDSGSMTVPSSALAVFPSGALAGIGLYRYRYNVADVGDGTVLEAVSSSGVLGTGTLY